jgi:integrase
MFPYLILYTGLRRGEALALTARDIDFKNNRITVNKSVYYEHNKPRIKQPKTDAGIRTVPLLLPLKEPLRKYCKAHKGYLFCDDEGELLPEYRVEDLLIAYRKATGCDFTPHQLRHAFATVILYENGIAAKDAQAVLGHAQVSTTLDIYTEFRDSRIDYITEQINKRIQ